MFTPHSKNLSLRQRPIPSLPAAMPNAESTTAAPLPAPADTATPSASSGGAEHAQPHQQQQQQQHLTDEQIRGIYNGLDLDGDGRLTLQELVAAAADGRLGPVHAGAEALLAAVDTDGNDTIEVRPRCREHEGDEVGPKHREMLSAG